MLALPLVLAGIAFAGNNPDTSPLPPKVIYHVGEKKYLVEDGNAGTIPADVWKKNIMGEGTRFGLPPYRRGLYGGANFDTLELYGNTLLGSPKGVPLTPWVMKIAIKDECRKPAVVTDLGCDPKAVAWFRDHHDEIARDYGFCLNTSAKSCEAPLKLVQSTGGEEEEDPCDAYMRRFLEDSKVRVVRDSEWDASWYLRDRDCIEKIEASPAVVLETLAHAKWDWQSRKSTYRDSAGPEKTNGYGMSTVSMLAGALGDSETADPAVLSAIREKAAASDIRFGADETGPRWVAETVPVVIDAFSRCAKLGRLPELRTAAATFQSALGDRGIGAREKQGAAAEGLRKSLDGACR